MSQHELEHLVNAGTNLNTLIRSGDHCYLKQPLAKLSTKSHASMHKASQLLLSPTNLSRIQVPCFTIDPLPCPTISFKSRLAGEDAGARNRVVGDRRPPDAELDAGVGTLKDVSRQQRINQTTITQG